MRQQTRRTRHQRSSSWFVATISVVLTLGIVGVVLASGVLSKDNQAAAGPTIEDHWHAAFGVNVCGTWLTNPPEFVTQASNPGVYAGIHTHNDGYIHMEAKSSIDTGANATVGRFLDYGGWSASRDSIDMWTGPSFERAKNEWSNDDRCPNAAGEVGKGEPGRIVFQVNCKTVDENPSDQRLADQQVITIGFLPKGEPMGLPPNAEADPNGSGCRPSAATFPGGTHPTSTTGTAATTPPSTTSNATP
jgi:hypothetical protein